MTLILKEKRAVQVRVVPERRGGWNVEANRAAYARCETLNEAETVAERLLEQAGSGELTIYDAYMRLRAARRVHG